MSGRTTRMARSQAKWVTMLGTQERVATRSALAGLPAPMAFDEAVRRALQEERQRSPQNLLGRAWEEIVRRVAPR